MKIYVLRKAEKDILLFGFQVPQGNLESTLHCYFEEA